MEQSPFRKQQAVFEFQLLNAALAHPEIVDSIQESYFRDTPNKEMFTAITSCLKANGNTPVHLSNLYALSGKKYTDQHVNDLSYWLEKNRIKAEDAESVVAIAIQNLREIDRKEGLLDKLHQAQGYILEGNTTLAVSLARSMSFPLTTTEPLTIIEMANSLSAIQGFKTGIKALDNNIYGLPKGSLIGIAGDTGSQKTMLTIHLCLEILRENPTFNCVYFEKEMRKEEVYRRLVSRYMHLKNEDILQLGEEGRLEERQEKEREMFEMFASRKDTASVLKRFHVKCPEDFHSTADMHRIILDYKADIWCLDYMSLLDGESKQSADLSFQVMENIRHLKSIVLSTGSTGIIINQLNKGTVEKRGIKIPLKDDMEWSSDIKKLCSDIFATFHPASYHKTCDERHYYLVALKARNSKLFNIPLLANPEYCTFFEPSQDDAQQMKDWLQGYQQGQI